LKTRLLLLIPSVLCLLNVRAATLLLPLVYEVFLTLSYVLELCRLILHQVVAMLALALRCLILRLGILGGIFRIGYRFLLLRVRDLKLRGTLNGYLVVLRRGKMLLKLLLLSPMILVVSLELPLDL